MDRLNKVDPLAPLGRELLELRVKLHQHKDHPAIQSLMEVLEFHQMVAQAVLEDETELPKIYRLQGQIKALKELAQAIMITVPIIPEEG